MKRHYEMKISTCLLLLLLGFFVSSCATTMPLNKDISQLDIAEESIAIMSLKMSNQYITSYQPYVVQIEVAQIDETNGNKFKVEELYNEVADTFNEYLVSFQLPPGSYKIGEVRGWSGIFPVMGHFEFPMDVEFELGSNTITYIGHVEMTNRERKDDEPRSGGIFPLIDQAATGFSGGTFDITISDRYIDDTKIFKEKYSPVEEYDIKNQIAVLAKPK